jgi:hypothetical protein
MSDSLISLLHKFSAGSANDDTHKHLWAKGASLFIDQLTSLLKFTDYKAPIIDINTFYTEYVDELANIFNNNKSDKASEHNYHILYSNILNKHLNRNADLNILEIGLGTNNPSMVSSMGRGGRPGASLYSWKEYAPNSNIFGADIDTNILFQDERIKTTYVDQLEMATFHKLKDTFGNIKYDLIVDDGLHSIGANFNTLLFALDNINDKGWIVIEDIHIKDTWMSIDFILSKNPNFKTYLVKTNKPGSWLYVINKL